MKNIQGIHSKRCWINGALQEATILIKEGKIFQILNGVYLKNENIISVGNSVLMPGIVDAHVHINEPGRTEWEGFETATMAAAAGGICTLMDMPLNSSPVTTTVNAFREKLDATTGKLKVNVGFYGGLIPGNENELEGLIKEGVLGIKTFLVHSGIDEFPASGIDELEKAMPVLKRFEVPILAHCELEKPIHNIFSDPKNYQQYLKSRPKRWENEAIDLMIRACEKFDCKTHIVHLSSAEALERIISAKEKGLPLSVETCPHYLLFEAENISNRNTLFKCAPPIREKENNDKLKAALGKGIIDFLATDHSPAPPEIKELESGNFKKAWGGIAGLQYLLSASWTALKDEMSLEKFIPLLTEKPAAFLGLQERKGKLAVGLDADLVVWNPESSFIASKNDLQHRHKISPYLGLELYGKVLKTFVDGKLVFDNGQMILDSGGEVILREKN